MSPTEVRNWIGVYTLLLASMAGAYLLLARPPLLPLDSESISSGFQILIPVLLAQVVTAWRFFAATTADNDDKVPIAPFIVKLPPIVVTALLLLLFLLLGIGGMTGASWTPTGEQFKGTLTFAVSILNATTVFVVSRFFQSPAVASARSDSATG